MRVEDLDQWMTEERTNDSDDVAYETKRQMSGMALSVVLAPPPPRHHHPVWSNCSGVIVSRAQVEQQVEQQVEH